MIIRSLINLSFLLFAFSHLTAEAQVDIKVASFNVRYDEPKDAQNNWKYRKDNVAKVILFHDADVIGMQEVLHSQLQDLRKRLPEYKFVGVARDDGKEDGEYVPVFFKAKRFEKLKNGTFWLSDNPEIPAKGWDADCKRVVSWVILKEKKSDKEFVVFNTHFDHRGKEARKQSSVLLLSKINEIAGNRPVIVTGDFNATPESEVIQRILDDNGRNTLSDSRQVARIVYNADWTSHGFGRAPIERRRIIDYVFVNNKCTVLRHGVLTEMINGIYLSDHCPVLAQIILK